jgi:hypothetical protein
MRTLAITVDARSLHGLRAQRRRTPASPEGEALRIAGCGTTVIVPAIGTAWDARYAIKATQLDHLPKRLTNPVVIAVWEGSLSVGRRVWNLAESERSLGPT